MGIIEIQLKHLGYELDMLVYTFDKLLLVEHLVELSLQAGQVNALIEAFCRGEHAAGRSRRLRVDLDLTTLRNLR